LKIYLNNRTKNKNKNNKFPNLKKSDKNPPLASKANLQQKK